MFDFPMPWTIIRDEDILMYLDLFVKTDSPVIIEGGTSIGTDTLRMKEHWPKSTHYGFEPNPDSFQQTINRVGALSGIYLQNAALSDKVEPAISFNSAGGMSSMFVDNAININMPPNVYLSTHDTPGHKPLIGGIPIMVNTTTIDSLNLSHVDLMWIDTEGAEIKVLKGAEKTLCHTSVIMIELLFDEFFVGCAKAEDVDATIRGYGFRLIYIWGHYNWSANAIYTRE